VIIKQYKQRHLTVSSLLLTKSLNVVDDVCNLHKLTKRIRNFSKPKSIDEISSCIGPFIRFTKVQSKDVFSVKNGRTGYRGF